MEGQTKSILVSYLERNKVFKIPQVDEAGEDLVCLKELFKKEFDIRPSLDMKISFQRYDQEWEEFVELEKNCFLFHKEKL